jgi:hypothetical protein
MTGLPGSTRRPSRGEDTAAGARGPRRRHPASDDRGQQDSTCGAYDLIRPAGESRTTANVGGTVEATPGGGLLACLAAAFARVERVAVSNRRLPDSAAEA